MPTKKEKKTKINYLEIARDFATVLAGLAAVVSAYFAYVAVNAQRQDNIIPIATPTVNVAFTPIACSRAIGKTFTSVMTPQNLARFGCPQNVQRTADSAVQVFQNGYMLWRVDIDQIYVVYGNGRWSKPPKGYSNSFRSNVDPEFSCGVTLSPPSPRRGFSKVWCGDSEVHQKLGTAFDSELGFCMEGGGPCESFQDFLYGFAYESKRFDEIYFFFDDGTWLRFPAP